MMRFVMMFLLLAGVGWADVPYRRKLLTAAELKPFLAKEFRVDPELEKFEAKNYGQSGWLYSYKYNQPPVLTMKSLWAVRLDVAGAKDVYSKMMALQAVNPMVGIEANWSKRLHVGDERFCVRFKGGPSYTVCFREGRQVGVFTFALQRPMSAKELDELAKAWLQRVYGERLPWDDCFRVK